VYYCDCYYADIFIEKVPEKIKCDWCQCSIYTCEIMNILTDVSKLFMNNFVFTCCLQKGSIFKINFFAVLEMSKFKLFLLFAPWNPYSDSGLIIISIITRCAWFKKLISVSECLYDWTFIVHFPHVYVQQIKKYDTLTKIQCWKIVTNKSILHVVKFSIRLFHLIFIHYVISVLNSESCVYKAERQTKFTLKCR